MNPKLKIIAIVAILILIFGFLGVRYITEASTIDNINIGLEDVSIEELKLSSCTLNLKVRISNPTTEYISELSAEFDVFIADTDVANGTVAKVSIPPESYATSDVLLTIFYADVGTAVINGIKTGDFDLIIQGEAKLNVLLNLLTITKPFTSSYSYS